MGEIEHHHGSVVPVLEYMASLSEKGCIEGMKRFWEGESMIPQLSPEPGSVLLGVFHCVLCLFFFCLRIAP